MAGHGKAAVLARLARAWGALRVTLSGVGRVLRILPFFVWEGGGVVASEKSVWCDRAPLAVLSPVLISIGPSRRTHRCHLKGGFEDERLGTVPFPMAGHGKAAVLARVARAWGALVVTLSVAGRVWYVRVFF